MIVYDPELLESNEDFNYLHRIKPSVARPIRPIQNISHNHPDRLFRCWAVSSLSVNPLIGHRILTPRLAGRPLLFLYPIGFAPSIPKGLPCLESSRYMRILSNQLSWQIHAVSHLTLRYFISDAMTRQSSTLDVYPCHRPCCPANHALASSESFCLLLNPPRPCSSLGWRFYQ